MKFFLTYVFIVSLIFPVNGQGDFTGTWRGVLIPAGKSTDHGTLLYLDLVFSDAEITGKTREEVFDSGDFAVKQITGRLKSSKLHFRQRVIEKSSNSPKVKWCLLELELQYDQSSGFLEGTFSSSDCKRFIGKVKLFRDEYEFSSTEKTEYSQLWFEQFLKDERDGLNAPQIRKIERDNFKFEPVYFDFDEATIRPEHYAFLNSMIKVVKGHTDLRVKVTGHTDSDGSDMYNDGLSERRAKAIIEYFTSHGLPADRLEFDFKGEKNPVDSNETPEGKQHNRRVDFSFI